MRVSAIVKLTVLLSVSASLQCLSLRADEPRTQRDQALKFLKAHLIGKTFEIPETTEKVDGGKVELVGSNTMSYSNLVESPSGLSFDLTTVVRQTNYDLDKKGQRTLPGHVYDRIETSRLAFRMRHSTGQLVGLNRTLTTTGTLDTTGDGCAVRLEMRDGGLELLEITALYDDLFAADDKTVPGAAEQLTRFSVTDGKVHGEVTGKTYDVDPATLKRTLKNDPPLKVFLRQIPAPSKKP